MCSMHCARARERRGWDEPDTLPPPAGGPDAASADRRDGGAGPDTASPPAGIDGILIDGIADWLISSALGRTGVDSIFEGCCQCLHAAGVPLVRALTAFRTLHPLVRVGQSRVEARSGGDRNPILHEQAFSTEEWLRSPMRHLLRHRIPFFRRRLTGPHAIVDFPVIEELRDTGITDYLCYLTPFASEAGHGANARGIVESWATGRPSGFSEEDLRIFERVHRRYAASCKVQSQDRIPGTCWRRTSAGRRRQSSGRLDPARRW